MTDHGHWLLTWLDAVGLLTSSVYATACTGFGTVYPDPFQEVCCKFLDSEVTLAFKNLFFTSRLGAQTWEFGPPLSCHAWDV